MRKELPDKAHTKSLYIIMVKFGQIKEVLDMAIPTYLMMQDMMEWESKEIERMSGK